MDGLRCPPPPPVPGRAVARSPAAPGLYGGMPVALEQQAIVAAQQALQLQYNRNTASIGQHARLQHQRETVGHASAQGGGAPAAASLPAPP